MPAQFKANPSFPRTFTSAWRPCSRSFSATPFMDPSSLQEGGCSHAPDPWIHYQHGDGLDPHRWTAKECHQYLEDRPWAEVLKFYSLVAAGKLSLSDLNFPGQSQISRFLQPSRMWSSFYKQVGKHSGSQRTSCAKYQLLSAPLVSENARKELKGGKWDRKTYKIVLSYDGSAFTGWQKQPGLYTVQGLLEQALGRFSDGKRAASLKSKGFSTEAAVTVAGRTDKGVHAAGQVCSFYTWRSDINPEDIKTSINVLEPKALRAVSVKEVSRTFHPNFSAQWRRYVYILPLHNLEIKKRFLLQPNEPAKPETFNVMAVNEMLLQLEGQQLSYTVFARDTKTSRSRGAPTECMIYHARAAIAELPVMMEQGLEGRREVMCVELVANRFLRKMVRVLVATSVREAAVGAPSDGLLRLTGASCRRASAPPAPPCGLCLTEVSYGDYSAANLLIKKSS